MTHVLHAAWIEAISAGRGVYVMSDGASWVRLLALRKGYRLLAIVGMRPDGGPDVVRMF